MTTNKKSAISEGAVLGTLLKRGFNVALPFGVRRFDLLVELNGKWQRAQIKTASKQGDTLLWNGYSSPGGSKNRPYTKEEIDFFLIYLPDTDKVYRVPVEVGNISLKLGDRSNSRTHLAKDFEV